MENYEAFKKSYFDLSHIDLNAYKEKQMKRRIETLITRRGLDSFAEYTERLKSSRNELNSFTDYITINVTEFFRTPECWHFFEEKVIPMMKESGSTDRVCGDGTGSSSNIARLKIWSAGCSTGEEPFSLAMLLLEHWSPDQFRILATDIDENVLERAEKGIFSEKSMETISDGFLQFRGKYFNQDESQKETENLNKVYGQQKNQFTIKEGVKNQVEFKKLDMTQEAFPSDCDLIVCRNVLIYFTEEMKQEIFRKFCQSLKNGGILFLGHTEQIVYYRDFGLEKIARNFYRKL